MVAIAKRPYWIDDLMQRNQVSLEDMVRSTGIDVRVLDAIAHQRYTPSSDQRDRVSGMFDVGREYIIWGACDTRGVVYPRANMIQPLISRDG